MLRELNGSNLIRSTSKCSKVVLNLIAMFGAANIVKYLHDMLPNDVINPKKILGMISSVMIITSILLLVVTAVVPSQNTEASLLAGFDIETGNVADLDADVAEEAEENNNATTTTTTLGAKNETTSFGRNMTNGATTKFLSIQSAQSGTLSQINATTYRLELENVSDKTILFSDRPDRIVTSLSTSDFISNWSLGADSFSADPPNAVLVVDDIENVVDDGDGLRQDIVIIELFNPEYDTTASTLKYDIATVNVTSIDLPRQFGQSTLVIDVQHPTQYFTDNYVTNSGSNTL